MIYVLSYNIVKTTDKRILFSIQCYDLQYFMY